MRGLPNHMLRTDKRLTSEAISQTCLPNAADATMGVAGIGDGAGEVHVDITIKPTKSVDFIHIPISLENDKKIITEDVGFTKEEMKHISKRFAMKRYLGTIDDEKEKDDLISNYDRAMKFIL